MCGILGIISRTDIIKPMIEGLKKLAYRGYDSSGLATINDQTIIKRRAAGICPPDRQYGLSSGL